MKKDFTTPHSKNNPLIHYRKSITSQYGEDGIIERIFEIVPNDQKWCVEFGAWDGIKFSNTYNLIANKNWNGVLIEGDKHKFKELEKTYINNQNLSLINQYVGYGKENSLDQLLSKTNIPIQFELLSVDIDGNDYHVWKYLQEYRPKCVVIEFNPMIPNDIEFIQPLDPHIFQGSSILSMVKLAREKGYELVCINQGNAFFIDQQYFHLFNIRNNSIDIFKDPGDSMRVFQLFDGSLVFQGNNRLIWHELDFDFNHLQPLPRMFRNLPWTRKNQNLSTLLRRILYRLFLITKSNKSQ